MLRYIAKRMLFIVPLLVDIAWWLSLYPGLAILVTVLGYNLLGEGIRDALDPRLRR
jgi:peptide/nickel transport system permease protein